MPTPVMSVLPVPGAQASAAPASAQSQNPLRQLADQAMKMFRNTFQEQATTIANKSGQVLVVVEKAQMTCTETIPGKKLNPLKVAEKRSVVEGRRLANIQDVKPNTNIKPWPCKCKKRPSGSDYKPCAYKPAGLWNPGVKTETSDSADPKDENQSDQYKKGYENGQARGAEANQAISQSSATQSAIQNASSATGISQDYMNAMAAFESTGNAAVGGYPYTGLYQIGPSAAQQVGMSHASVTGVGNVGNNAMAAAQFAQYNAAQLASAGYSASPLNLYLAHQQGAGGATSLLDTLASNPNAPLTPNMANQGYPGVNNHQEFYDYTKGKLDGASEAMNGKDQAGGGQKLGVPVTATLKCTFGGTIQFQEAGQRSKYADPGSFKGTQ